MLQALSFDKYDKVRAFLAGNTNISVRILEQLTQDEVTKVRIMAAQNNKIPVDSLDNLAKDKQEKVRLAVAHNLSCSLNTLKRLTKDDAAIEKVLCVAEVITPSVNSVQKTLNNPILKRNKALRDNLILQSILDHAITQSDTTKVFLSNNTKEFGNAEARFALRASDAMYFSNTNSLISWIDSQS